MKLRKCPVCSEYTFNEVHCSQKTRAAHPARFKLNDKYADYRA
ncbi:ribosome biogenesis protein [Candidatus Micrarchaeota archaeon CG08_land_8_20_14_0_20_49_17]|nr:MAG: ribosome biogenesis protein [Candidatus Micrarchaeota archaeon CG08_land_8_20_14_0_20_49_17]PIU82481.1 MAG: ribosome biogenesis protein [Candidatus Micrarchaeota archaeon CG06_land_8_20_14_3_00_50_6]PIZ92705.1 MAG: ribosome biogenesis protein [Candidatus Micrarchaeota archaeon CG_4_10_14_0_2_um_filter_49_7]HII53360.1 ribosome biogenesis protein [Candidatus Micrarchaeota archaeon]